jgi:hypothetical protein
MGYNMVLVTMRHPPSLSAAANTAPLLFAVFLHTAHAPGHDAPVSFFFQICMLSNITFTLAFVLLFIFN